MSSQTGNRDALDVSERQELERLRAEVTRLREHADEPSPPARRSSGLSRRAGRTTAAVLLIAISCALAPLSVVAVWARGEVTDTDRYVSTVSPLASDPAIQQAVSADITNTVFQYIDVQGLTQQVVGAVTNRASLPPQVSAQLQALTVPLASGIRSFVQDRIHGVVTSDVFAQAWVEANRTAHQQLVAALTGQSDGVVVDDNAVSVKLAPLIAVVKQRLVEAGFTIAERIPAVDASFVVFRSADVGRIQTAFHTLDTLGYWLPFVLTALALLGIYTARNHRRAFISAGIGLALAMFLTSVALAVVRNRYLEGVPAAVLPQDAAAVLYDTVVRYLRDALRAATAVGLLLAVGAFLTGPSVTAVTLRRWITSGFAALKGALQGRGMGMAPVTAWTAPKAALLRGLVVAAALAVVLLERYRTLSLVGWLTLAVLVALAVIEFLEVQPRLRTPRAAVVPAQAAEVGVPG